MRVLIPHVSLCANLVTHGPRCKYSNVKEIYSARSIAAPSAIGDMVAHTDCVKTVPTVQLYRAVETDLAQSKGDTHELSVSSNITTLIEKWEGKGGLKAGCKGEEGGSSSRRVSQEFEKTRNIFERGNQSVSPTENLSLSFSSIKTIGGVGSGRKTRKLSRVYTHASVGPKVPISISTIYSSNMQTESESIMGSFSVSNRINGRTLLAETGTNRKHGRGEGDDGSNTKRIRRPWR